MKNVKDHVLCVLEQYINSLLVIKVQPNNIISVDRPVCHVNFLVRVAFQKTNVLLVIKVTI